MEYEIMNYPLVGWNENTNPGYLYIEGMSEKETSDLFGKIKD